MKITCHMLVKNEENFIWFSLNSIIDYVDEVLVWDNQSIDNTVKIVESINSPKIKLTKGAQGDVAVVRQKMLDQTEADWIFIHDGDEIWHKDQIASQIEKIKKDGDNFDVVVNPNIVLIGDMYHILPKSAGKYKIHDRVGHYNIRFIKNLQGLTLQGVYPTEAYVLNGIKVQEFPRERISFSDNFYLHASFLQRSVKVERKIKYEIGNQLPLDYFYPEVFFVDKPELILNPWKPMIWQYKLQAFLQTPIKKMKRRII